jgi:phage-related minor tail protein
MATNAPDQRTIEIVLKAQDANASMKELGAGAAVMTAQLSRMGQDDPGRAKLLADLQGVNQRLAAQRAEMRDLGPAALEVVVNGQKVSATFNEMKAAGAQLEKQLGDLSHDDPGRAKMLADYKALQQRIGEVKDEMGETTEKGSLLKEAMAFAGVTVGAEAVLDGIKELGAEVINTTKEVATLRSTINGLTGATGDELDNLTTSVISVSRTFGKDFNEVLAAGNVLSKQMGVSQQEAMRLISQGFVAGADAGGDFLDQVKEYAPQFKDAGFAAADFIGHISQSATQGIFSDKGADVVKEFGLRIREQTKATSDAMQAAFGSDFTNQVFGGIKDGSLTVEQALQRVAKEMDETKIPANQLQTVIADVFGGPGEDAGIAYLKSLKDVGKGVDDVVDKTNVYTQRQAALLESNQELAEAQNALTKEFEGGGSIIDTLTNKSMTVLYALLASLGATFKELYQPVQEIWKSLASLAEVMGLASQGTLSAMSAGQALGAVVRALLTPLRLGYTIMADLTKATMEWAKSNDTVRGYLQLVATPVIALFALLKDGPAYFAAFSAGAETAFGSIGRAWQKVKSGDFAGAKEEFFKLGTDVGDAYNKAFAAASSKKVTTSATVASGGDDPNALRTQGGDGITDADRQKAAEKAQKDREKAYKDAKAARDKADQEHLNDLKNWVKDEGGLLDQRNVLKEQREQRSLSDEEMRRELERQRVFDDADKKAEGLSGKEADYTERLAAIVEERDLHLRELQAKFEEQDEQERQKKLDEKLQTITDDEQVDLELLENKRAWGLLSEQEYQEALYTIKREALEKQLQLLVDAGKSESSEAKKVQAALLKGETDKVKAQKAMELDFVNFKKQMNISYAGLLTDALGMVTENLDKQSTAFLFFKGAMKTAQLAEIGMNVISETSSNAKWAAADPRNALPGGAAIVGAELLLKNGMSIGRGALAAIKIAAFEKGGPTNQRVGEVLLGDVAGMLSGLSGGALTPTGSFAPGGPVTGPTLGLIGEAGAELVIPNWMYADPKQANLMGFLEAQIASRGNAFADGGSTTKASVVAEADPTEDTGSQLVVLMQQLVRGQQEFRDEITDWQRGFEVNLDPRKAKKAVDMVAEIQKGGGIR